MRHLRATSSLLLLSLFALAPLFAAGCASNRAPASTRYRQAQNEMVYRARSINLGTMFPTGGMSRDPSVSLNTWATCSGENCRPNRAWFSFTLRGSGRSDVLSSRNVEIRTDQNQHEWPANRQQIQGEMRAGSGSELTRIRMSLNTLRDIAQSQGTVRGQLGSQDFSLSYEDRAPLRALLQEIDGAGQPSAS